MPTPRPHGSTIAISIICIIAVGSTALYVTKDSTPPPAEAIQTIASAPIDSAGTIATSSDWKKSFFTDTATSSPTAKAKNAPAEAPQTLTDQFGREFFTQYMTQRQSGADDTQLSSGLADQMLSSNTLAAVKPKVYSTQDIHISSDTSVDGAKKYLDALGAAFKLYTFPQDELQVAQDSLTNNNPDELKIVDQIAAVYKTILNSMISMPVPQTFAQMHLQLLNGISSKIFIAESLKKGSADPLYALMGTDLYLDTMKSIYDAENQIRSIGANLKISFAPDEPGNVFAALTNQ